MDNTPTPISEASASSLSENDIVQTPSVHANEQKELPTPVAKTTHSPQTSSPTQPISSENEKLGMLMDVNLSVTVELGRTNLTVREVLDLQRGSVVELDRMAGDVVDILINDHLFAHGEVVVVDDKFGVRITEIVTSSKHNGE